MYLQQTKRASRTSGGPQYYLHDLDEYVKLFLRSKGAVPVALITPYGATLSDFFAVGKDHKLGKNFEPVEGKVGHDRIQKGRSGRSIGEDIRHWYNLNSGDFERIDVDINFHDDKMYITPLRCKYANSSKPISLTHVPQALTFTQAYQSRLWITHLTELAKKNKMEMRWAFQELCRVVSDHRAKTKLKNVQESDLLRASGPLSMLGIHLSAHVSPGYDCPATRFRFLKYPDYVVPVELKKNSKGFKYQEKKYDKDTLRRAVILCAHHEPSFSRKHVDVLELEALCDYQEYLKL